MFSCSKATIQHHRISASFISDKNTHKNSDLGHNDDLLLSCCIATTQFLNTSTTDSSPIFCEHRMTLQPSFNTYLNFDTTSTLLFLHCSTFSLLWTFTYFLCHSLRHEFGALSTAHFSLLLRRHYLKKRKLGTKEVTSILHLGLQVSSAHFDRPRAPKTKVTVLQGSITSSSRLQRLHSKFNQCNNFLPYIFLVLQSHSLW